MANNPYVNKVIVNNQTIIDLSGDTVAAAKLLDGYTAHDKSGAQITGNIQSLAAQTITPALTEQEIAAGKYLSGNQTIAPITASLLTQLDPDFVAENIKKDVNLFGLVGTHEGGGGLPTAPEKDVNFIDYDGEIRYSYTAAEFAALSALPANPDHSGDTWAGYDVGLTGQGWNWTLSDAKAYVAKYGKLWIGALYLPDDDKFRVFVRLTDGRTSPYLGICINGTATVNWGDGDSETVTGSSLSTPVFTQHEYDAPGEYLITVQTTSWIYLKGDSTYGGYLLWDSNDTSSGGIYCKSIVAVQGNSKTGSTGNMFYGCTNLEYVTLRPNHSANFNNDFQNCMSLKCMVFPSTATNLIGSVFRDARSLKRISLPKGMTQIGNNLFYDARTIKDVSLPEVTTISTNAFSGCESLTNIIIPDTVTSISSGAFNRCASLGKLKFCSSTPPTVAGASTFQYLPTDCVIYAPSASLPVYQAATNYPDPQTYSYVGY